MKRVAVIFAAACVLGSSVGCLADEGTDYSYLEDMTVKELRALDAEIHKLLGDGDGVTPEDEVTEEVTEDESEPVMMSEEEFFEDILQAFSDRQDVGAKYSKAEQSTLSGEERVAFFAECVGAEKAFYDKYKNAAFEDLNVQYLCKQYVTGIKNQLDAPSKIGSNGDLTFYNDEWNAGYNKRCYVIVELADYFNVAFPADSVALMRTQVEALDALNAAEKRNAQVPRETVMEVQTLLHEIGFKCWNIDGVAGKKTVKAIKRFQEMYGFDIDGMIDDELIEQLKKVKAEKGITDGMETESNVDQ